MNNINISTSVKACIFSVCLLVCCQFSYAQIRFQDSFSAAEKLSRETGKPLAVMLTVQPKIKTETWMAGLKNRLVINKLNSKFITYLVDSSEVASIPIIEKYELDFFPAFIFIDNKGGLIRKMSANTSYLIINANLDKVLAESKETSLADMDLQYLKGDSSRTFLESYINKRIKAGLYRNAELLEKYTMSLEDIDLDYTQTLFILKAGPWADGTALARVTANRQLLDNIFQNEQEFVIQSIIKRITENTLATAISERKQKRANAAAEFARVSGVLNSQQGQKTHDQTLMRYYKEIGDTAKYLSSAMEYYQEHYMKLSWDSIQKKHPIFTGMEDNQSVQGMKNARNLAYSVLIDSRAIGYSTDLNEGAWSVYESGTDNPVYLYNAIQWAERAIAVHKQPAFYRTLGLLYYRMGIHADAEKALTIAVGIALDFRERQSLQQDLDKIKLRT